MTNEFFYEEVYKKLEDLIKNYIKPEYFTHSLIGLNENFNVYNTLIIVLFNNLELIIDYFGKIKNSL